MSTKTNYSPWSVGIGTDLAESTNWSQTDLVESANRSVLGQSRTDLVAAAISVPDWRRARGQSRTELAVDSNQSGTDLVESANRSGTDLAESANQSGTALASVPDR